MEALIHNAGDKNDGKGNQNDNKGGAVRENGLEELLPLAKAEVKVQQQRGGGRLLWNHGLLVPPTVTQKTVGKNPALEVCGAVFEEGHKSVPSGAVCKKRGGGIRERIEKGEKLRGGRGCVADESKVKVVKIVGKERGEGAHRLPK